MHVSYLLFALNIGILLISFLVIAYAAQFRRLPAMRWVILLSLSFFILGFCTLYVYLSPDFELQVLFSRFRFFGFALIAPSWILFVSCVFQICPWLQKKWVTFLLFVPCLITMVFTAIPQWRDWVVTDFTDIEVYGLSLVRFRAGSWYPFHIATSLLLTITAGALLSWVILTDKGVRRKQAALLLGGSVLAYGTDIYCVLADSPFRWLMLSCASYTICELSIVYSTFKYSLLSVAPLAMSRVFQGVPDPVLVLDEKNQLWAANQSARMLFEIQESMLGKDIHLTLPNLKLHPGDTSIRDQDGHERFYSVSLESITQETQGSAGTIVFFREMTAQKTVERKLNDNLEFKARLLAVIAHDLSGNIQNQAFLSSFLEKHGHGKSETREITHLLASSSVASQDLIRNLLSWAKSQELGFRPALKALEINALIEDCVEALSTSAKIKGISVVVISEKKPLLLTGDSEMLSSVIRNILSNAIRACDKPEPILIELQTRNSNAIIHITDSGPGMHAEQVKALLEMPHGFFKKEGGSHQGYGIGLSIVRRFVELHQGELAIDSTLNVGTRVSFSLPL